MKYLAREQKIGEEKAHFVSLEDQSMRTTRVRIRQMVEPSPNHDDRKEMNAEDIAIDLIEELNGKKRTPHQFSPTARQPS